MVTNDVNINFKCPFCNRDVVASWSEDSDDAGIMHVMPMCESFERLPPDEYLKEVNRRLLS